MTTTKKHMTKNDVIELITSLHDARIAEHNAFVERANATDSNDEQKELLLTAKKHKTHAKYLARMIDNQTLLDAVASQVVQLKLSANQIKDIENDAYSLRKFAELMISFAQKRKVNDEHSFSEALAVIMSGVTETTSVALGRKMRNKNGAPYGARQAQMTLKLLERLGAATVKQDSRNKVFCMNQDSAVFKRIAKAYE